MRIMLSVPTLQVGGMERVVSVLANEWAKSKQCEVHIVTLSNKPIAYTLHEAVKIHVPNYDSSKLNFINATLKSAIYLIQLMWKVRPDSVLAFGDRYNSLSILAARLSGCRIFISNRQNPFISNGKFIDTLNSWMYPFAHGLVAQTSIAAQQFGQKYKLKNVTTVPNPFPSTEYPGSDSGRKKIVLNVGRFGDEKNQFDLVRYFTSIDAPGWELIFLGDGAKRNKTEEVIAQLPTRKQENIKLLGSVLDVEDYYVQSAIFAFTSRTEGFPNALGEAMQAGCACISYDCVAGPSDLIDHEINGLLIPAYNEDYYEKALSQLIESEELRIKLGKAAQEKMKRFQAPEIARLYLEFISK